MGVSIAALALSLSACGRFHYDPLAVDDCADGSCVPACGSGGGARDLGFGPDGTGIATVDFGPGDDSGWALARDRSGNLYAAGRTFAVDHSEFALARLTPDGALDTTFGDGGTATIHIDNDFTYDVAVQPDGKIILGGDTWNGTARDDWAYVRLEADGSIDTSFGTDGVVLVDFGDTFDTGSAIGLADDGKIYLSGAASYDTVDADFGLVRLMPDGSFDSSFGTGGITRTDFGGGADGASNFSRGLIVFPDGSSLAAGGGFTGAGLTDFGLVRLAPDGSLDPAFGTGGRVSTDFGGQDDEAASLSVDGDGRVVAAGYATISDQKVLAIVRYLADGSLDPTFGNGGRVTTPVGTGEAIIHSLVTNPSGDILVVGAVGPIDAHDLMVARYCADGSVDTSFGDSGFVVDDLGEGDDIGRDFIVQPEGIVVVGETVVDGQQRFALARYRF